MRVVQGERFVTATDGEIPKRQVPPQMKGEGVLSFPECDRGFHERERADVIVGVLVDVSQRMSRPRVEWIGSERPFTEVSGLIETADLIQRERVHALDEVLPCWHGAVPERLLAPVQTTGCVADVEEHIVGEPIGDEIALVRAQQVELDVADEQVDGDWAQDAAGGASTNSQK